MDQNKYLRIDMDLIGMDFLCEHSIRLQEKLAHILHPRLGDEETSVHFYPNYMEIRRQWTNQQLHVLDLNLGSLHHDM